MNNQSIINWTSFELPSVFGQSEILNTFIKPIFSLEAVPSKGRLSELINGKNTGLSSKTLEKLAKTTKDRESGQDFVFTNYPYLKTAEKIWENHIDSFPTENLRLSTIVQALCINDYNIRILDDKNTVIFDLSEKLKDIAGEDYSLTYQLAVLSILATMAVLG